MAKPTYLTSQLRESAPYLKDAGWHETSKLVSAAADELEALRLVVEELRPEGPAPQANENQEMPERSTVRGRH